MLTGAALVALGMATAAAARAGTPQDSDEEGPGRPPLYQELREAEVSYAGEIRGGRFRVDRFELELEEGRLYLAPEIGGGRWTAVFVGDGRLLGYPPDAVEHHQLERFSDEHQVDEAFDRLVLWSSDDTAERLRALAAPARERRRDTERANRLLRDRRRRLLEERNFNPESRIIHDLWRRETGTLPTGRAYRLVELDSKDHGWLTLAVEPHDPEEVVLYRHDDRRGVSDTWMRLDALTDYGPGYADRAFEPFPVDPDTLDDDEATGVALGLPPRPVAPDREGWTPRARVPRTEVDIALDGDGDVRATAALLIEPLAPTRGLRLQISMMLEVTDVRWRADPTDRPAAAGLLSAEAADPDADPGEPTALSGEPLPFAQEQEERTFEDDHFEPWVTVALPRTVAAGEPFVLELAYEGPLVDRLRQTRDFVLLDTLNWWPQHADNRTSRLAATFRMPERYRVATGGTLLDERVEDDTRIQRWATTGRSAAWPSTTASSRWPRSSARKAPPSPSTPTPTTAGSRRTAGRGPSPTSPAPSSSSPSTSDRSPTRRCSSPRPRPRAGRRFPACCSCRIRLSGTCTRERRRRFGPTRWPTSGGALASTGGGTTATSGWRRASPTTRPPSTRCTASTTPTSSRT